MFNGSAWEKIDNTSNLVTSFQGRKGVVLLTPADYVSLKDGTTHKVTGSSLNDLADIDLTVAPTNGQILKWNSSVNKWEASDDIAGGGAGSISTTELANGAVTYAKMTLNDGELPLTKLAGSSDATKYLRGDKSWQTLNSDAAAEGITNLYFTNARALGVPLVGFNNALTGAISATDSVLMAFGRTQNQLNNKLNSSSFIDWSASGIQTIDPTRLTLGSGSASKAMVTSGTGALAASAVTASELGYLSGVSSNIQTQLNSKTSSQWTTSGSDVSYTAGKVGVGTTTPTYPLDVTGNARVSSILYTDRIEATSGFHIGEGTWGADKLLYSYQNWMTAQDAYGVYGYRYATGVNGPANKLVGTYGQSEVWSLGAGNTWGWTIGLMGSAGGDTAGAPSPGTVTNAAAFYVKNHGYNANLINKYGLYLENISGGTNNYSIYSNGGNNYFAGNVGIGTTAPWSKLHVETPAGTSNQITIRRNANTDHALTSFTPLAIATSTPQWNTGIYASSNDYSVVSWDGTTALNALTVKVGGKVGIGTTTPNYSLEVLSSASSLGLTNSSWKGASATSTQNFVVGGNAGERTVPIAGISAIDRYSQAGETGYSGAMAFLTESNATLTEKMRITSIGNVGIGTTTPTATLHISGASGTTLKIVDTNQGVGKVLTSDAAGVATWQTPATSGTVTSVTGTAPIVSSGGNTPAISITQSNASTNGYLSFADWTIFNNKEPAITAQATTKYFRGDKTFVDLGTDVRASALTGLSSTAGSITAADTVLGAFGKLLNTQSDYVSKTANSTITGTLTINSIVGALTVPTPVNVNDAVNKGYVDGFGQWLTSSGNVYRSSGNVGIGTASPVATFDILGPTGVAGGLALRTGAIDWRVFGSSNGSVQNGGGATAGFHIGANSAGTEFWIGGYGNAVANSFQSPNSATAATVMAIRGVAGQTGDYLQIRSTRSATNGDLLTVNSSGNVGIGTSGPASALQVGSGQIFVPNGTVSAPSYAFTNSPGSGFYSPGANDFRIANNGSDRLRSAGAVIYMTGNLSVGSGLSVPLSTMGVTGNASIGSSYATTAAPTDGLIVAGNVGIGTSGPATKLTVLGTGGGTGTATFANTDYVSGTTGSGILVSTGATSGNTYSTINAFQNGFGASGWSNLMLQSGGGNVGIGTTSPSNILSLSGTAARTIAMERNTNAATPGQGLTLSSGGAIAGTSNLAGGDLSIKSGISTGTGTSSLHFLTATAGSSGTTDNTPTEKMTILGSGNVGIGVTNPAALLSVANSGAVQFNVSGSASAVNFINLYGGATTNSPTISAAGTDTNVGLNFSSQNAGAIMFDKGYSSTTSNGYVFSNVGGLSSDASGASTWRGVMYRSPTINVSGTNRWPQYVQFFDYDSFTNPTVRTYNLDFLNTGNVTGTDFVLAYGNRSGGPITFNTTSGVTSAGNVERLRIMPGGNIGIGTSTPSYTLHVNGSVAGTSAYNNLSDERFKKNIVRIPNALEKVLSLEGVFYNFRTEEFPDKKFSDRREMGVIAQKVEKIYPEIITKDKDGYRSVAYTMLIAPIIEAIKDFYRKWFDDSLIIHRNIASIDDRAKKLEIENAQLKARANKAEKENSMIKAYLCAKDSKAAFCH